MYSIISLRNNSIPDIKSIILRSSIIISVDPGIKNFTLTILENLKVLDFYRIALEKNNIYVQLTQKLDQIISQILNPDKKYNNLCLVIEKQFNSILLNRISQHVISYFLIKYPDSIIIETNSRNRVNMLRRETGNKEITKKDSINWAIKKFKENNDIKGIEIINNLKKKDDFSDTLCQIYALIY